MTTGDVLDFQSLAEEVQIYILTFCPLPDLYRFSLTGKYAAHLTYSNDTDAFLWYEIAKAYQVDENVNFCEEDLVQITSRPPLILPVTTPISTTISHRNYNTEENVSRLSPAKQQGGLLKKPLTFLKSLFSRKKSSPPAAVESNPLLLQTTTTTTTTPPLVEQSDSDQTSDEDKERMGGNQQQQQPEQQSDQQQQQPEEQIIQEEKEVKEEVINTDAPTTDVVNEEVVQEESAEPTMEENQVEEVDTGIKNVWRKRVMVAYFLKWDLASLQPDHSLTFSNNNRTVSNQRTSKWDTLCANLWMKTGYAYLWEYNLVSYEHTSTPNSYKLFMGIEKSSYDFNVVGFDKIIGYNSNGLGFNIGMVTMHTRYDHSSNLNVKDKVVEFLTGDTITLRLDLKTLDENGNGTLDYFRNGKWFLTVTVPTVDEKGPIIWRPAMSIISCQTVSIRRGTVHSTLM